MKKLFLSFFAICLALAETKAQNFSKAEAEADIDSLISVLTEVHPMYIEKANAEPLVKELNAAKATLPETLDKLELYSILAPIIAKIGDAHTTVVQPFGEAIVKAGGLAPFYPTVDTNTGRLYVKASCKNCVPVDAEILSVNGVSAQKMMEDTKRLVSGERDFFKYCMIDNNIMGYFHLLYAADEYEVTYRVAEGEKEETVKVKPVDSEYFNNNLVLGTKVLKLIQEQRNVPYSYKIDESGKFAILYFDSCMNPEGMDEMCKEMVAELNQKGIKNLIVDVRLNGGGNSNVGDELLKYISPVDFRQYGKTIVRVTPTTHRLGGATGRNVGVHISADTDDNNKKTLPASQRFNGKVYLLTSHTTFSSASSFAWAFKKFGCGMVIGEETGGMNVHYGDVLYYRMPNSQLDMNLSHKRFWQPGADDKDIHGLIPDIIVPQDQALDKAIEVMRNE